MPAINKESIMANASPTKRFFISMLTRDIELQDAILDLLDNCVDGILRAQKGKLTSTKPYSKYWAEIKFSENSFSIKDNCGGIPIELARRYAFMMGRPEEEDEEDSDIPTVGMYGIGMKRAIFKMGRHARIQSHTPTESFEVEIAPKWMTNDNDWELPITRINSPFREYGTRIGVISLAPGVSQLFAQTGASPFSKNLTELIGHHFSFIIRKGFKVLVNGTEVTAKPFSLLQSEEGSPANERIEPYLYRTDRDGVEISLAVGFHSPMLGDDDLDEEQKTKRSKEDAGWTIICNDRVVVYNDKTRLTGWGEAGVPSYHAQFIGIAGVVVFKSNDAWKLPITTTKRGLDTSSELYLYIKDFMREGMKRFTSYTNLWKSNVEEERRVSQKAKPVIMETLLYGDPDVKWTNVHNRANELKYSPRLAAPRETDPPKQIAYSRPNWTVIPRESGQ